MALGDDPNHLPQVDGAPERRRSSVIFADEIAELAKMNNHFHYHHGEGHGRNTPSPPPPPPGLRNRHSNDVHPYQAFVLPTHSPRGKQNDEYQKELQQLCKKFSITPQYIMPSPPDYRDHRVHSPYDPDALPNSDAGHGALSSANQHNSCSSMNIQVHASVDTAPRGTKSDSDSASSGSHGCFEVKAELDVLKRRLSAQGIEDRPADITQDTQRKSILDMIADAGAAQKITDQIAEKLAEKEHVVGRNAPPPTPLDRGGLQKVTPKDDIPFNTRFATSFADCTFFEDENENENDENEGAFPSRGGNAIVNEQGLPSVEQFFSEEGGVKRPLLAPQNTMDAATMEKLASQARESLTQFTMINDLKQQLHLRGSTIAEEIARDLKLAAVAAQQSNSPAVGNDGSHHDWKDVTTLDGFLFNLQKLRDSSRGQIGSGPNWDSVAHAAKTKHHSDFSCAQLLQVIKFFASARYQDEDLYTRLLAELPRCIAQASGKDLIRLVGCLGRLRIREVAYINMICAQVVPFLRKRQAPHNLAVRDVVKFANVLAFLDARPSSRFYEEFNSLCESVFPNLERHWCTKVSPAAFLSVLNDTVRTQFLNQCEKLGAGLQRRGPNDSDLSDLRNLVAIETVLRKEVTLQTYAANLPPQIIRYLQQIRVMAGSDPYDCVFLTASPVSSLGGPSAQMQMFDEIYFNHISHFE